jgi:hypothetical protein
VREIPIDVHQAARALDQEAELPDDQADHLWQRSQAVAVQTGHIHR